MDEKNANIENVESGLKRHANYDISSSNPKKRYKSSKWDFFTALPDGKTAKCNYCGKEIDWTKGIRYLKYHNDRCDSYKIYQEIEKKKVLTLEGTTSNEKHKLGLFNGFCKKRCRQAIVKMIILDELPFSFVENKGFRYFCNQEIPLYKVPSRKPITRDVLELFSNEKASLKIMLSGQRVSFTTDIWTAITKISYMVITVHFIDENWKLHRKIISFSPISSHNGKTIAKRFEDCLIDWDIKKVFTITVDNTNANNLALNILKTEWKKTLQADGLILDGEFMHVRCAAHILNLIVREGLKKVSESVNSIRNAVKYVRSSNSRLQAFQMKAGEKKVRRGSLAMDYGSSRWNATFYMLRSALKFKILFDRMAEEDKLYEAYFHEYDILTREKKVGPPSSKDWDNARVMVEFLNFFYESTLAFSFSNKVTSNMCYSEICKIEKVLRIFAENPNSDITLKNVAHTMKYEKFDKYWEGPEKINKILIVASVFDPCIKMGFLMHIFKNMYGEGSNGKKKCTEMKEMVLNFLRKLFNVYNSSYQSSIDLANNIGNQDDGIPNIYACSKELDEEFDLRDVGFQVGVEENSFGEWSQMSCDRKNGDDQSNELDIYLMEKIVNPKIKNLGYKYNLLDWWKVNIIYYPVLARMAKDIFAIPVSTVASESAFSTGGRILNEYRSHLSSSSLESLILTKNWLRSSPQFDV